jgi:hypothetical protein
MDPVEQGELELQGVVVSEFSGGSPLERVFLLRLRKANYY